MTPTPRLYESDTTRRYFRNRFLKGVGVAAAGTFIFWLAMVYASMPAHAHGVRHHHRAIHRHVAREIPSGVITCDLHGCRGEANAVIYIHKRGQSETRARLDGNGNLAAGIIRSEKTGATAHVAPRYAATFQSYINDVEAAGGRITFMGGYRPGPCSIPRSKHPCGMALDLCQFGRGIVDHHCHLPNEDTLAAIAREHGLLEGGVWCHGDRGHAEIRTERQAEACGSNLYSAVAKFKHGRHVAAYHRRRSESF